MEGPPPSQVAEELARALKLTIGSLSLHAQLSLRDEIVKIVRCNYCLNTRRDMVRICPRFDHIACETCAKKLSQTSGKCGECRACLLPWWAMTASTTVGHVAEVLISEERIEARFAKPDDMNDRLSGFEDSVRDMLKAVQANDKVSYYRAHARMSDHCLSYLEVYERSPLDDCEEAIRELHAKATAARM